MIMICEQNFYLFTQYRLLVFIETGRITSFLEISSRFLKVHFFGSSFTLKLRLKTVLSSITTLKENC